MESQISFSEDSLDIKKEEDENIEIKDEIEIHPIDVSSWLNLKTFLK